MPVWIPAREFVFCDQNDQLSWTIAFENSWELRSTLENVKHCRLGIRPSDLLFYFRRLQRHPNPSSSCRWNKDVEVLFKTNWTFKILLWGEEEKKESFEAENTNSNNNTLDNLMFLWSRKIMVMTFVMNTLIVCLISHRGKWVRIRHRCCQCVPGFSLLCCSTIGCSPVQQKPFLEHVMTAQVMYRKF